MLLKAALNGARVSGEHPALPVLPEQLAAAGAAAVAAGAGALHLHVRTPGGEESLAAGPLAETLQAVRAACPGTPVGISTGAWIEPDAERRLTAVRSWHSLPDFASVNFHEPGATALVRALLERGIAAEAGLDTAEAGELLVESGLGHRCLRVCSSLRRPSWLRLRPPSRGSRRGSRAWRAGTPASPWNGTDGMAAARARPRPGLRHPDRLGRHPAVAGRTPGGRQRGTRRHGPGCCCSASLVSAAVDSAPAIPSFGRPVSSTRRERTSDHALRTADPGAGYAFVLGGSPEEANPDALPVSGPILSVPRT